MPGPIWHPQSTVASTRTVTNNSAENGGKVYDQIILSNELCCLWGWYWQGWPAGHGTKTNNRCKQAKPPNLEKRSTILRKMLIVPRVIWETSDKWSWWVVIDRNTISWHLPNSSWSIHFWVRYNLRTWWPCCKTYQDPETLKQNPGLIFEKGPKKPAIYLLEKKTAYVQKSN